MLVVTGAHGSGKSAFVLGRFREAVRSGRSDIRFLVPTATLVEHLRHELAREGLVFRPELIQTFFSFAKSLSSEAEVVSRPLFYVAVEDALRRVAPVEFTRVADAPGFAASLAQTIEVFDAAGCDPASFEPTQNEAPLAPALASVWRHVNAGLRARRLVTRTGLLRTAAFAKPANSVREIWFDGFAAFSDPELDLVAGIAATREITITLPDNQASFETRERLARLGAKFISPAIPEEPCPPAPERVRFFAESLEREVEEIARRILTSGKPFREIGVALRNPEQYRGLLEGVFERFGIPARFYFATELAANPAAAYLISLIDALLSGWDHEQCLAALRLAPVLGVSPAMDRLDFEIRKQLPGIGLVLIRNLVYDRPLARLLTDWDRLDAWRTAKLTAAQWALKLGSLRTLFAPPQISTARSWDRTLMYRSQAAALDVFESAMAEAAEWWSERREPLSLEEFWRVAKMILRTSSLRVGDARSNVVHVMSVYEARQWDLAIMFVCGLAEKEFPRRHPQNPFVPDAAIRRLRQDGLRVPTSEDRNNEEQPLFEAVAARPREQLVLSYAREEQNLPSAFYLSVDVAEQQCVMVQPAAQPFKYKPTSTIASADLLPVLRARGAKLSVTSLENFLQCPFKFFSRSILKLYPAPPRPEDRLDFLQQGNIVHQVLADWCKDRPSIGPLFEARFRENCDRLRVPASYRTEVLREQMRTALERFAADEQWPRGNAADPEQPVEFDLADGVIATGRIDRLETLADGSVAIIDYKYSSAVNTKKKVDDETLLQGPLYVAAVGLSHKVSAMVYYNVRTDPNNQDPKPFGRGNVPGLSTPLKELSPEWVSDGLTRARLAVEDFRSGRVRPEPADPQNCRFCDFRDACRWEFTAAIGAAGS